MFPHNPSPIQGEISTQIMHDNRILGTRVEGILGKEYFFRAVIENANEPMLSNLNRIEFLLIYRNDHEVCLYDHAKTPLSQFEVYPSDPDDKVAAFKIWDRLSFVKTKN